MAFAKGRPKTGGRKPGRRNKVTETVREQAQKLLALPAYRTSLLLRLEHGTLAPGVEQMLWYYAFGKPKEELNIGAEDSLLSILRQMEADRAGKDD